VQPGSSHARQYACVDCNDDTVLRCSLQMTCIAIIRLQNVVNAGHRCRAPVNAAPRASRTEHSLYHTKQANSIYYLIPLSCSSSTKQTKYNGPVYVQNPSSVYLVANYLIIKSVCVSVSPSVCHTKRAVSGVWGETLAKVDFGALSLTI